MVAECETMGRPSMGKMLRGNRRIRGLIIKYPLVPTDEKESVYFSQGWEYIHCRGNVITRAFCVRIPFPP